MVTEDRIKQVLHYDPETGVFTWRCSRGRAKAGDKAGADHHSGYWRIRIDDGLHNAHRLAWLYMTGAWPVADIDHINGDRADNRFANLREATRSQNLVNRDRSENRGIRPTVNGKRWRAEITVKRKPIHLGTFDTKEEASRAFAEASKYHFGAFSRSV